MTSHNGHMTNPELISNVGLGRPTQPVLWNQDAEPRADTRLCSFCSDKEEVFSLSTQLSSLHICSPWDPVKSCKEDRRLSGMF